MKVWIDQDLCTGDGLCEEIAPDVFTLLDDGLAYVKEGDKVYADGQGQPAGRRRAWPTSPTGSSTPSSSRRGVPRRVHLHRGLTTAGVGPTTNRARARWRPRGAIVAPGAARSGAEAGRW